MNIFFILEKAFALKAAFLIALPFIISAFLSCGDSSDNETAPAPKSAIDAFLESKKTMTAKAIQNSYSGEEVMLPNEVFHEAIANRDTGTCLVLRKSYINKKIYMQFVQVEIIASSDAYKIVTGIHPEDALFVHPAKLMREFASTGLAKKEQRFLFAQRVQRKRDRE